MKLQGIVPGGAHDITEFVMYSKGNCLLGGAMFSEGTWYYQISRRYLMDQMID